MKDGNTVFDDIMTGLHEIEEHHKGNLELPKRTITSDNDADIDQLLWHKIIMLQEPQKQKLTSYVDELLRV